MKKIAGLMFIIFLFSFSILADMPPPPIGEKIRIEVSQNYPDYQFYIASYDLKVVPNPNPPHPSRPDMVVNIPDTFKLRQIELSLESPFTEAVTSSRIQYRGSVVGKTLWLVAAKKSLSPQEVESKVKEAIDSRKNGDGIYTAHLSQELEYNTSEKSPAKTVLNKVTKLDEKGLEIGFSNAADNKQPGSSPAGNSSTNSSQINKSSTCIGAGLFLTGLAFIGIWWTRKRII